MASTTNRSGFQKFLLALGPGLMFAGTSIGVSHIAQSTRAGALYGFGLVWAVVFAHVSKMPFFTFAPRYAVATGEHLLQGYRRVGSWAFYLFFILSLCTMFPIQSAVTLVCTGLFANLFSWNFEPVYLAALILASCMVILLTGKYPLLDRLMKILILFLGVSTILAFLAALFKTSPVSTRPQTYFNWMNVDNISFLIAFMGWMPTTLEISVWHSFWSIERTRQTGHTPSMKHALGDFHIGYWGTMLMAMLFLGLGALVMYGTGQTFSHSAVGFTGQVIDLYTQTLGPWSKWVIGVAAATTMFSTTLCCLDAFPRVIREAIMMIWPSQHGHKDQIYFLIMSGVVLGSLFIIGVCSHQLKRLIDIATTVAFLTTPIFAYLNLRVVTGEHMPEASRPSMSMLVMSWVCLFVLVGFALFFINVSLLRRG